VLESLAAPLAVAALVVAVVALVVAVRAVRRRGPGPAPRPFPALTDADALEAYLTQQQDRVGELASRIDSLTGRAGTIEEVGRRAVQRVGLVRYNPFEDTGSNQSFALALLDEDGNGVILSSLHSRQQTRLYVKEIAGGKTEAALSAEESEALRRAGETA